MIIYKIEEADVDAAKEMASDMGLLRNSITSGDGSVAGFISEIIAARHLGGVVSNTYDYDVIADGVTYDVKCKRCTSPPKPYYDVSIANYNTTQECDRYLFTRVGYVNGVFGHCYLLGFMAPSEYYSKARKLYKGQQDGDNGYIVKADCYNLQVSQLRSLEY